MNYSPWGCKELDVTEHPSTAHEKHNRASLVVQWLRLHTLNAGGTDVSPGQGTRGFLCDSAVKNLTAMQEPQETWVQPLGLEDPLKEGIAVHSSVLAWRISWTEEPAGLQSVGTQKVRHNGSDLARAHIRRELRSRMPKRTQPTKQTKNTTETNTT